jgi:S-adenosylmethionine hydrolase
MLGAEGTRVLHWPSQAVVDPNMGKDREVAIETGSGRYLVGPDNGVLSLAWEASGGVRASVQIDAPGGLQADLASAGLDGVPALSVEAVAGSAQARRGNTYADFAAGEYGVLFDPRGWLTVVRGNPASALEGLGVSVGDPVWITRSRGAP